MRILFSLLGVIFLTSCEAPPKPIIDFENQTVEIEECVIRGGGLCKIEVEIESSN